MRATNENEASAQGNTMHMNKITEDDLSDGRADGRRNIGRGTGCNKVARAGGAGYADDKCSMSLGTLQMKLQFAPDWPVGCESNFIVAY